MKIALLLTRDGPIDKLHSSSMATRNCRLEDVLAVKNNDVAIETFRDCGLSMDVCDGAINKHSAIQTVRATYNQSELTGLTYIRFVTCSLFRLLCICALRGHLA